MKRAKRVEKVEVKSKRIEKYWTEETCELFGKLSIPMDSNEDGTKPSVDPTMPLLMHIMQCIGSFCEVSRKYEELGPEFAVATTPVGNVFSKKLENELRGSVLNSLQFNVDDPSDKAIAVQFLSASRSILECVPSVSQASGGNDEGRILLHDISMKSSDHDQVAFEAMKLVLKANGEGAKVMDHSGRLPLHCMARSYDIKSEAFNRLVEQYPEAIMAPDFHGWLPLHYAVSNPVINISFITRLLQSGGSAAAYAWS